MMDIYIPVPSLSIRSRRYTRTGERRRQTEPTRRARNEFGSCFFYHHLRMSVCLTSEIGDIEDEEPGRARLLNVLCKEVASEKEEPDPVRLSAKFEVFLSTARGSLAPLNLNESCGGKVKPLQSSTCSCKGEECIFQAIKAERYEQAKQQVAEDPSLSNAMNRAGRTLLMESVTNPDLFAYLLEHGANPHLLSNNKEHIFWLAGLRTNVSSAVFEMLLEQGIDPNVVFYQEKSILHLVLETFKSEDDIRKVLLLTTCGINVNHKDKDGTTALMIAVSKLYKYIDLAKILLENGADPLLKNSDGKNSLMLAATRYNHHRIFYRDNTEFKNYVPMVQLLLQYNCDFFARDNKNKSIFDQLLADRSSNYGTLCTNQCNPTNKLCCNGHSIMYTFTILLQHAITVIVDNGMMHDNAQHLQYTIMQHVSVLSGEEIDFFMSTLLDANLLDINMLFSCSADCTGIFTYSIKGTLNFYQGLFNHAEMYFNLFDAFIDKFGREPVALKRWVDKLHDKGFSLVHEDPRAVSPLTVLVLCQNLYVPKREIRQGVFLVIKHIIESGVNVTHQLLMLQFKDDKLNMLSKSYQLFDALWMAGARGSDECLRLMLSYWPQHPMMLLMFFKPLFCNSHVLVMTVNHRLNVLAEIGGLLPRGPDYDLLLEQLTEMSIVSRQARTLMHQFENLHSSPPSLQVMCRTLIRKAVGQNVSGNDLPQFLRSMLPPGRGLKNFVTYEE